MEWYYHDRNPMFYIFYVVEERILCVPPKRDESLQHLKYVTNVRGLILSSKHVYESERGLQLHHKMKNVSRSY